MEFNIKGERYWLSLEEVQLQTDWYDWREYLMSKYGVGALTIPDEDSFENWKLKGKPKARLWH